MKAELTGGGVLALAGVVAVAGVALWVYSKRGTIAKTAETVVASVNPADSRNLVNRGVSAVGEAVTGEKEWSLGGQLAEWFSPSVRAANESLKPAANTASYDEAARLAGRYPAPEVEPAYGSQWYGWGVGA